jgi:cell division septation protein DedD
VIAHEHPVEAQDTDSAVAQVEAVTTWREALLARLRPADHSVGDEEIFALLNDESDGHTAAELCARSGVTVPMYCLWKAKYRQLSLDELRHARRREQRRRTTVIGVVLLAATLSTGGVVAGLSWAMLSAFTGSTESPSANAAAAVTSDVESGQTAAPVAAAQTAAKPAAEIVTVDPPLRSDAKAETGYRIQIAAADSEQQGRAMVAELAAAGYPVYTTHAVVGNKNVFRVRVGPFDTLPAAEEMAARLRSAGYAGVWIAR